jgi:hypothetical protein
MTGRLLTIGLVMACAIPVVGERQSAGDYRQLVRIHEEFIRARQLPSLDDLPDYRPEGIAAREKTGHALRARLNHIDPRSWPVSQRVDYLLVRAALDGLNFDHRVVRPWARDPGAYVDPIARIPYAALPLPGDRLTRLGAQLEAVPGFLSRAAELLTTPAGELAEIAIRQLEQSDGINQGEPRRAEPPPGVIGWYADLLERLPAHHPELVPAAQHAHAAVVGFRDTLKQRRPSMTEPAWIGLENYDWYLRHVRLMPFTSSDVRELGRREEARARTFLAIEQHRNRDLPPMSVAHSEEEHARRVREAEAHIREFIRANDLMTMPEGLPAEFQTDAFWTVRPGGKRHFWEELTYRDPRNNHIHASIPGHQFDSFLQRRTENPIRRGYRDGARAEGWAFYIEEMFVQAGLLDDLPRAKELFYIAQLKRGLRIPSELQMQTGAFTLQQAIDHMVREVPLMEPDLARYDLAIYLRRPTYGMNYVMGKIQLEQLLADRASQLGDEFHLGRFHDEFLAAGPIPISLIRWELTGLDDEVQALW